MLRTIVCDSGNRFKFINDPNTVSDLLKDPDRHIWMDLEAPTEDEFRMIAEEFDLHPLAIEDAHVQHQRPKVEQYDNFYFVVFYSVNFADPNKIQKNSGREAWGGSHFMPDPDKVRFDLSDPARANGPGVMPPGPMGQTATDVLRAPADEFEAAPSEQVTVNNKPGMQTAQVPAPTPQATKDDSEPKELTNTGGVLASLLKRRQDDDEDEGEKVLLVRELSMFMGSNYLITVHSDPIPELAEAERRWRANSKLIQLDDDDDDQDRAQAQTDRANNGSAPAKNGQSAPSTNGAKTPQPNTTDIGILLYSLLDTIVDDYFPVIDNIVDRVEDLEEQIFERFDDRSLQSIFELKKDLLALRKVLSPERDVLNVLTRRDVPIFANSTLVYFQDIYDHVVRITDSIDTYRDLLSSALDSYLSMQSNRLNITVQTLTSASIILMTVTLVAGIYGMNFDNMPELHWTYGYFYSIALMIAIAVGLYVFFKRKRWL